MATPDDLLRPVRLKLGHADQIGQSLATSVKDWVSSGPLTIRHEYLDANLGFRLVLEEFTKQPDLEQWGLLVGDYIHNLRSALDNLAYALARLHADPPAHPGRIAFPIYEDQGKFASEAPRRLDQLPSDAADLIESFQPWQRTSPAIPGQPEHDVLALLAWLSNQDKHRVPAVVALAPEGVRHNYTIAFASEEEATANGPPNETYWAGPLAPGVALLEHRTKRPIVDLKGTYQLDMLVAVETPIGYAAVLQTLGETGARVSLVCDQFKRLFE